MKPITCLLFAIFLFGIAIQGTTARCYSWPRVCPPWKRCIPTQWYPYYYCAQRWGHSGGPWKGGNYGIWGRYNSGGWGNRGGGWGSRGINYDRGFGRKKGGY
ncbi:uncharacterized protein LOC127711290 [Mytilus californianus]|uniref:uncharacterized protein LOC127711290 n=1 Tax=Mytilus californianus TaxID=6549 RepID=UPI0022459EB3|nr:uncharacterized protein LOC127711290 [Mytilus californianus]